ncbi:DUF1120 domain-containing protein [Pseudomonas violetae]|jgi:type 1 fimbria pilin|uniref:DUF1120 domain-containing protein n=1 Tax=Pseudomonas violetae TaxID=2915813 RepID=A0ABT0F1L0_9PSED|nr:DUF1120 domain-containing protein [Pseudomonas violetae]MCK1791845.1 DUF1120 domain-containing protein [Pseudomonas violetae]
MDRCSIALLAPLLILGAPAALAVSSTQLSVTGMITPSACTPSLSDGGTVHHGKLTVKDLKPDQPTALENGTLYLEVICEAATPFTLTTIDNRPGSSAIHPNSHGLGVINEDQNLGSVALGLFDTVADGEAVKTIISLNDGASWRVSSYLGHAGLTAFAALNDLSTPIAIKKLTARLTAFTTIVRANDLTLTDEVPIDGHVTVQLNY